MERKEVNKIKIFQQKKQTLFELYDWLCLIFCLKKLEEIIDWMPIISVSRILIKWYPINESNQKPSKQKVKYPDPAFQKF